MQQNARLVFCYQQGLIIVFSVSPLIVPIIIGHSVFPVPSTSSIWYLDILSCIHLSPLYLISQPDLLWLNRFALALQICFGSSDLLWLYRFALALQICFGSSDLLWLYRFALALQICFGSPDLLWLNRFALAQQICFGSTFSKPDLLWHIKLHIKLLIK